MSAGAGRIIGVTDVRSVKALVINQEGKLLVLMKIPGNTSVRPYWDLPGGRIENGAGEVETLRREIAEELGIKEIKVGDIYDTALSHFRTDFEKPVLFILYVCTIPENSQIELSKEHNDYRWIGAGSVHSHLSHMFNERLLNKLSIYLSLLRPRRSIPI